VSENEGHEVALGSLTPNVSYSTRMDNFITGSTLLVFLAVLVAILTVKLATSDRRELAGKAPRTAGEYRHSPAALSGRLVKTYRTRSEQGIYQAR
jgi:hypothetical protein